MSATSQARQVRLLSFVFTFPFLIFSSTFRLTYAAHRLPNAEDAPSDSRMPSTDVRFGDMPTTGYAESLGRRSTRHENAQRMVKDERISCTVSDSVSLRTRQVSSHFFAIKTSVYPPSCDRIRVLRHISPL